MTCVLAFDTALFGCGVAVIDTATEACAQEAKPMPRGQAEHLMPIIMDVMKRAGKEFSDLDAIGITTGPGAFTGLRIGLSTARTFGVALDIPVIGHTTLEILAAQYRDGGDVAGDFAVLLETKRKDYYAQIFDGQGKAINEAACFSLENLVDVLPHDVALIGDCLERFKGEVVDIPQGWSFVDGFEMIDPLILAERTVPRYENADNKSVFTAPEPVYLRGADVSVPKTKQRQIAT